MKFYDKGFVNYYDNHINLQLFNIGTLVLDLSIYKNKICKGTFECLSSEKFNKQYLDSSYKKDFLYNLFMQKTIYHRDRQNGILIKVTH